MNSKIKFIYFDVGGVAILDFSKTNKWNEMLSDLGISDQIKDRFDELFDFHEKKICIGEDINIFVNEARSNLGINFPPNYNMTADFVSRFEKNSNMLELLDNLKGKYRLGLLTGQYPNMLNLIFEKGLLPRDIWDVIIDSSVEGVTKPDPKIYEIAEKRASVKPNEILFIDNKASLLELPKERGWNVFEYDPATPEESTKFLESIIFESEKVILSYIKKFVDDSFGGKQTHFERTIYWTVQLKHDADLAMQIAAYAHDIERSFVNAEKSKKLEESADGFKDEGILQSHQEEGAKVIYEYLVNHGQSIKLAEKVKHLISKHEVGGDEEQNILKDADSISYFECNAEGFIAKFKPLYGIEKVKSKLIWMFERITSDKAKKIAEPMYKEALNKLENLKY